MRRQEVSSARFDARSRVGPVPSVPQPLRIGPQRTPIAGVGTARLYVCGITPYDVTHLGHAATFVWADTVAAVLASTGVATETCRNITDVDDVLTIAAKERGRYFDELALTQEATFEQNMRSLRVAEPEHQPRARHHIDSVVQLAATLIASDAAYEHEGFVYFHGGAVADDLDHSQRMAALRAIGEDLEEPRKKDPLDVPIWRPSAEGDPAWSSPWGWGRPGWHAECAAMSLATVGGTPDVLVGGTDLRYPHHAYQSAMATAATGVDRYARATVHVGEVRIDGAKMAKSTGNLVLVGDVLTTCEPAVLRMLLLDRPYAEAWNYRAADIGAAEARLADLYAAAGRPGNDGGDAVQNRLLDDLDVTGAIDAAITAGGEAARSLIRLLRLG